jgi:hypothetical protein
MPQADQDPVLERIMSAIEDLVLGEGCVFIGSVARINDHGEINLRCGGRAPGQDRYNAEMMLACINALVELQATLGDELTGVPEDDPGTFH